MTTSGAVGGEEREVEPPLRSFGTYEVHECLGVGGMGSVWLALQRVPLRRWVALKVVKMGLTGAEFTWRFAGERRALARMAHPAIARIHEAGITPDGRPYIAMELIDGEPITSFCDAEQLGLAARVHLFLSVCEAMQHAHQRGVVHRDLKPSNILVVDTEAGFAPKVIDFGVAMALDARRRQGDVWLERGQVLGTPEYMSPEQAARGEAGVDRRTDVYALGVLLFELLTGLRPTHHLDLRTASAAQLRRLLRKVSAPLPSAVLAAAGADALGAAAVARSCSAGELVEQLRYGLDDVVVRAIRPDVEQRYQSARQLWTDLQPFAGSADAPAPRRAVRRGRRR